MLYVSRLSVYEGANFSCLEALALPVPLCWRAMLDGLLGIGRKAAGSCTVLMRGLRDSPRLFMKEAYHNFSTFTDSVLARRSNIITTIEPSILNVPCFLLDAQHTLQQPWLHGICSWCF